MAQAFEKMHVLHFLKLSLTKNNISSAGALHLTLLFSKMNFQQLQLFLGTNEIGTGKQQAALLQKFGKVIDFDIHLPRLSYSTNQTDLQLVLAREELSPTFTKHLALALLRLTKLNNLYLMIPHNNIGDIGTTYLGLMLTF